MGIITKEVHVKMPWGLLALKTWNSDQLEPMIVIHGAQDNAGSFDPLIPLLSPDFYYVCVDLPGHGYSSAFTPGLPLSFMHFIAVLQGLIYHFAWNSFSLMGHSFGAHLALVLAASEHVKISRMILLDGTVRNFVTDESYLTRCSSEVKDMFDVEVDLPARSTTYDTALNKLKNRLFPLEEKAARAVLKRSLVKTKKGYYSNADPRTCFTTMPHMGRDTHVYNCRTISCPVLIIYPKQSPLLPVHLRSPFHQTILKVLTKTHDLSRLQYVQGDHCVHCNNPEIVAPVINQFLKDSKNVIISYGKSKF